MPKILGILSAIAGLLGLMAVLFIFGINIAAQGHAGQGMTLVIFQFWGAILSMFGIASGIIAVWLSKGAGGARNKGGRMGIACGVLGVIALFAAINLL